MRISDWSSDVCSSDLFAADVPGSVGATRLAGIWPVDGRGGLYLARRARADRHEEADRLFVRRAHGVRHHRAVRLQHPGHRRRDDRRSEERRVGKEWVSTFRSWWWPYH